MIEKSLFSDFSSVSLKSNNIGRVSIVYGKCFDVNEFDKEKRFDLCSHERRTEVKSKYEALFFGKQLKGNYVVVIMNCWKRRRRNENYEVKVLRFQLRLMKFSQ